MIKFYCYPKCSTCQKAKKFLDMNNVNYELIDIKKVKFSILDIKYFHQHSQKELRKLFNTSGILYKEMNLKDKIKSMSEDEIYEVLSSDTMLIKRPILVTAQKVYIGFNEDEYQELLKKI
ncbi:MAG TPA: arsenate reductase family protein [Haloplasmataceae bacterium]